MWNYTKKYSKKLNPIGKQISAGARIEEDKTQLTPGGYSALNRALTLLSGDTNKYIMPQILLGALRNAANNQSLHLDKEREINADLIKHVLEKNQWHLGKAKYLILHLIAVLAVYSPTKKQCPNKDAALTRVSAILLIMIIYYQLVSHKTEPMHKKTQREIAVKIKLKLQGKISALPPKTRKTYTEKDLC